MISSADLTHVDYGVFCIMGLSCLLALWHGFIYSALSTLGWALSIYTSYSITPHLWKSSWEDTESPIMFLGYYGGTLIVSLVAFSVINMFVRRAVAGLRNGFLDKTLGLSFGILRGILLIGAAHVIFSLLWNTTQSLAVATDKDKKSDPLQKAYTYPFIILSHDLVENLLPEGSADSMLNVIKELSTPKTALDKTHRHDVPQVDFNSFADDLAELAGN